MTQDIAEPETTVEADATAGNTTAEEPINEDSHPQTKSRKPLLLAGIGAGCLAVVASICFFVFALPEIHYGNAEKAFENEAYAEAANEYAQASSHDGVQDKLKECIVKLVENQDFDNADKAVASLANVDIDAWKNYVSGARALAAQDWQAGLDTLSNALSIEPGMRLYINTNAYLAQLALQNDDGDTARSLLANAAKANPSDQENINYYTFLIAESYFADGLYDEAKSIYEQLPSDYSIYTEEPIKTAYIRLGEIAVIGTWQLVEAYEDGTSFTDLDNYIYSDGTLLSDDQQSFYPNGKWSASHIIGSYGDGAGTWSIDAAYAGPNDYALIFDEGSQFESRGFIEDGRLVENMSSGSSVRYYEKAQ